MNVRTQRGSAILLAIIVVFVVAVIAAGVLRYTSRELAGATAGRQSDALVACAEAGRQLLLSQFRVMGVKPDSLTALNVPLDASSGGSTRVRGGHVDSPDSAIQVEQVKLMPGSMGSERRRTKDLTNITDPKAASVLAPYRVMVHCDDHGRRLEVEFGVRFGL
jgi:hypothetical protein